jgi:xylulokinase
MDPVGVGPKEHWLGLDFGTSSVKALLVTSNGAVRGRASAAYTSNYGPDGEVEQDPAEYLEAARTVIAECGATAVALGGIGLAGQTPTLVLVGADGKAVRPALTWQDHRAESEARELADTYGPAEPLFGTHLPWTPAYAPAKLLWLARHEPQSVARTRWILQPKDFVGLTLTGSPVSDAWSSKGLCNVRTHAPVKETLTGTGWPVEVAPPLAQAWETRGTVTARAAAVLGLPEGTPVSVGWSDAVAGMLAVGAFEQPIGFVLAGTSSIVGISTHDEPSSSKPLLEIPAACAPLSVLYGPTEAGGASVEWLARLLRCEPSEALDLASSATRADGSPLFVPYLAGERAPIWRTDVRGALLGLSVEHGAAELARAVVTGVCLSELHVLAIGEARLAQVVAKVHVAGRRASGPPWREARLAALGRPLQLLDESNASALGAAMLAAAAANGGDLAAARGLRAPAEQVIPEASEAESAQHRLDRYLRATEVSRRWADET